MYQTPSVSTDPIISRLRPRSVQEIIDGAFRLYRAHFLTFLSITALIYVPVQAATQFLNVAIQGNAANLQRSAVNSPRSYDSSDFNSLFTAIFVLYGLVLAIDVIAGLPQYLSQGALTSAVAGTYMDEPASVGRAYRHMSRHMGPLLGAIALQILIIVAVFTPAALVFGISIASLAGAVPGDSGTGAGAGLAMCFLGLPLFMLSLGVYLFLFVRLQLVVPSIMVENLGPVQAIKRSWALVRNYWWRTFGLQILMLVFSSIITIGPAFLIGALLAIVIRPLDLTTTTIISSFVTIILSSLFIPLKLTSFTLYYFDLRVRKESFDLEQALNHRYAPSGPGGPGSMAGYPGGQAAPSYGAPMPTLGYATPGVQPYATAQGGAPALTQGYPAYPAYSQGYQQPQHEQGYAPSSIEPGQAQYYPPQAPGNGTQPTFYSPPTQEIASPPDNSAPLPASNGPSTAPLGEVAPDSLIFSTPTIAEQAGEHPGQAASSTGPL